MSLTSIPLTFYGLFREPFKLLKFIKLALNGAETSRSNFYNVYDSVKNKNLFYVGLHDEEHLYLLSKKAGPLGKLVVFTTTKSSHDQFIRLKRILGLKNVVAASLTFSITSNELIFAAQPAIKELANSAMLKDSRENRSYKKIEISYNETLDNYFISNDICPEIVEIKLPWHELAVLKGATKILTQYKPKLIIECDVRFSSKSKVLEIFQFLHDMGYKGYFMLDSLQIPISSFDFDIYQNAKSDFYCKEFIFE